MNQSDEPGASPWHAGERQLQESVGVADQMEIFGRRVVRDYMPDQHRLFYNQLPYLVLGAVDEQGMPWATLLEGPQASSIHQIRVCYNLTACQLMVIRSKPP